MRVMAITGGITGHKAMASWPWHGQVSGQWYIEPVGVLSTEKLQQLQHSRRMALQAEAKS